MNIVFRATFDPAVADEYSVHCELDTTPHTKELFYRNNTRVACPKFEHRVQSSEF